MASAYPGLAELIPLPEESFEHRTIGCLRIGTLGADAADGALFVFGQHAREWVPPEVALAFAADVLYAYTNNQPLTYGGKSYTAAQIHQTLDAINVFVVACANPDGRIYTMIDDTEQKRLSRADRNISHHPTGPEICHGVDLNRNYDFAFDLDTYFSSSSVVTSYTSDKPCHESQGYQGPNPFSEWRPATFAGCSTPSRGYRWFIDIHGYRGEIYYPFGDDENQTTDAAMNWRNSAYDHQRGILGDAYGEYMAAGDLATHLLLGTRLQEGILPVRGRSYRVTQTIITIYPTAGTSSDYTWSRHLVDWTEPRVEAFAIEHHA